jgi:prepilin-type N-terminal cleavage/methylation domain-containing protein
MKRVELKQRGFTVLEVLVAMALLAVIIAAAMGAFLSTNASANQSYITANMQESSRLAIDALAADLRMAGLGASNGTIGMAPGGAYAMRIPTIYTSATTKPFTDPNGTTYNLSSIYIIGADPATIGPSVTGDGILGVISDPTKASILCTTATIPAATVDCAASAIGSDGVDHRLVVSNGAASFAPLLLHDHQRASIILPTSIDGFTSTTAPTPPVPQNMNFSGSTGSVQPSPNPAAPFGFAQGFQVSRLRVVHWYLKQVTGQPPRLYRSRPVMTTASDPATGCATPFVDEDSDKTLGVAGTEIAAGPIEALQFSFVFDPLDLNDPTQFVSQSTINPCTTSPAMMRQLREVRVQMVAIAPSALKDKNGAPVQQFTTPTFEGVASSPLKDAFPRRTYTTRVAPRNIVPYRL